MDTINSLRRYLTLKNTLIPATEQKIHKLGGKIFGAKAILNGITDEKVFWEDFKWQIRTRGFTIFNLIYLPSIITFIIILLVIVLAVAGIAIIGVVLELLIRVFILSQDIEFEDTLIYVPIKAIGDVIDSPPSIPIPILIGLLIIWLLYSFRQIQKNKVYYEDIVIPENRKKNALVPGKRRKQQLIVDDLKNTLQSTNSQLFSYQKELQNIINTIPIPNQYWSNDEILTFLLQKLEYKQAKSINEALNLWEQELLTRRVEQAAKDVIRETRASEERLARQRQEHYNQAVRAQQDRDEVQKKISEELKRRNDRDEFYDNIAKKNGWL